MSLIQAILMGIIQGLTEFLPVSSSGHLAIFKNVFGVNTGMKMTFDILLHVGTLIAVFIVYWADIKKMIIEGVKIIIDVCANIGVFFSNRFKGTEKKYRRIVSGSYRKFVVLVIVSTIPTGIIGVVFKDLVEKAQASMLIVGVCLLITACELMIADRTVPGRKTPKNISYLNAAGIGVAQGIATLPGISRSGTTITVCLLCGFDKRFAVKYSFIMSIPAIMGAAILDVKDIFAESLTASEIGSYIAGTAVSAVVGFFCIKFVLSLVRNRKFKYFGFYCIIMGLLAILYHFGVIG